MTTAGRHWTRIAGEAAAEAGGPPADLLGDYLPMLAAACATGERFTDGALAAFRALGARAADENVALPALIDLYLSATWRAWRHLPAVTGDSAESVRTAGEAVLHATDDAVAAVADGFMAARRFAVRVEESIRREFVDDLLAGGGSPAGMLARAERFGLDPTVPHVVAVLRGPRPWDDSAARVADVQAALARAGVRGFLVTTRHGMIVVMLPVRPGGDPDAALARFAGDDVLRIGLGRAHSGVAGIARSYGEARDALELADRLGLRDRTVRADHLLVYQVLLRDRTAISELIGAVLEPLRSARGGAGPLLGTIDAYVATGGNTSATARRLHLSVRAVTYRLRRVHALTGHDPADPADRFTLQTAVLGARALGWPERPLSP